MPGSRPDVEPARQPSGGRERARIGRGRGVSRSCVTRRIHTSTVADRQDDCPELSRSQTFSHHKTRHRRSMVGSRASRQYDSPRIRDHRSARPAGYAGPDGPAGCCRGVQEPPRARQGLAQPGGAGPEARDRFPIGSSARIAGLHHPGSLDMSKRPCSTRRRSTRPRSGPGNVSKSRDPPEVTPARVCSAIGPSFAPWAHERSEGAADGEGWSTERRLPSGSRRGVGERCQELVQTRDGSCLGEWRERARWTSSGHRWHGIRGRSVIPVRLGSRERQPDSEPERPGRARPASPSSRSRRLSARRDTWSCATIASRSPAQA